MLATNVVRVLVKLQSTKRQPYQMEYHYPLQGFIYNMLRHSKFRQIHDKQGYKFFCFSSIFPAYNLENGDTRHLIISSPDRDFIEYISSTLREKRLSGENICIGSMEFKINRIETIRPPFKVPCTIITGTPIIIRVPKEKFRKFEIKTKHPYEYLYWRRDHPLEIFVKQLEDNLRKKYSEFTGSIASNGSIIQGFMFRKQLSTRVFMKGGDQVIIGSTWEFLFNDNNHEELLRIGIDCGFGERNSLGFGFMNVLTKK